MDTSPSIDVLMTDHSTHSTLSEEEEALLDALDNCAHSLSLSTSCEVDWKQVYPLSDDTGFATRLQCRLFALLQTLSHMDRFIDYSVDSSEHTWSEWEAFFGANKQLLTLRHRLMLFLSTFIISHVVVGAEEESQLLRNIDTEHYFKAKWARWFLSEMREHTVTTRPFCGQVLRDEMAAEMADQTLEAARYPWMEIWEGFVDFSKDTQKELSEEYQLRETVSTLDTVFRMVDRHFDPVVLHRSFRVGVAEFVALLQEQVKGYRRSALIRLTNPPRTETRDGCVLQEVLSRLIESADLERAAQLFPTSLTPAGVSLKGGPLSLLTGSSSLFVSLCPALVIEGRGILSTRHFNEGEVLFREGATVALKNMERVSMETAAFSYLRELKSAVWIHKRENMDEFKIGLSESDGERRMSDPLYTLQFVNHSCTPNSMLVERVVNQNASEKEYCLVSIREISPWEEVTVSYTSTLQHLTSSPEEKECLWGFDCQCPFCLSGKKTLLDGFLCPLCDHLVRNNLNPTSDGKTLSFRHSVDCVANVDENCAIDLSTAHSEKVKAFLCQLTRVEETILECTADELEPSFYPEVVGKLLQLERCFKGTFPSTHFALLRLRLDVLSVSSLMGEVTAVLSTELLKDTSVLLEDMELLLNRIDPLLTGLRMYYVFMRGRHVSAMMSAERSEKGTRLDECCGAVREEDDFLQRPFVQDGLLRRCVIKSFQEHVMQYCWCSYNSEEDVLYSFLRRFQTELYAAGIENLRDIDTLSCITE